MQPYAAILDERGHSSALSEYKAKDFKESVGKDLLEGAASALGDRLNIKALKYKKYVCVNATGRVFSTYLEDIPAQVMNVDGKISDVYKNDEQYRALGEPIAPAVNIVPALSINTKEEKYIFYGNGIQVQDIQFEYERLKASINDYQTRSVLGKSKKIELPHISLPKIGKKGGKDILQLEQKDTENVLIQLKSSFAKGELTESEYQAAVNEVLDKL